MGPGCVRLLLIGCASIVLATSCSPTKRKVGKERADDMLREGQVLVNIEDMPGGDSRLGTVTGVVNAPRARVWKVISDYNEQKHFMPNLIECFAIRPEALELVKEATPKELTKLENQLREYKTEQVDGKLIYTYGVGDFPWPMPDKRYILRIERDPDRYTTHATMVIGQMNTNETSWELKPYGADSSKTLATYKVLLDPGMPVPGFAINLAANSILPEVIKALRRQVKDPKYGESGKEGKQTAWCLASSAGADF